MLVVYIEQAQRRCQSCSKLQLVPSETSWLPLKINSAGVIPVIFASSFYDMLPSTILSLYAKDHSESGWYQLATNILIFQNLLVQHYTQC